MKLNSLNLLKEAKEKIDKSRYAKWWRRKGSAPQRFKYFNSQKKQITNEKNLDYIRSLVIPPAWKYVRISPSQKDKILAVGIDGLGRFQYIYNPKFSIKQTKKKFAKIENFGKFLPSLRKVIDKDLKLDGFPCQKVLAIMIHLMSSLYIRVGTDKSVKLHKTYGITTLKNQHLKISSNGEVIFSFVGKHHIKHQKSILDKKLAQVLTEIRSIGRGKLFQYLNSENKSCCVSPSELNNYIKQATSDEFSAKDFRTWGATLSAAAELAEIGVEKDKNTRKKNIVAVVKKVAEQLGNTPSVCRNSYIHPIVLKAYQQGKIIQKSHRSSSDKNGFKPEEKALLKLFKEFKK